MEKVNRINFLDTKLILEFMKLAERKDPFLFKPLDYKCDFNTMDLIGINKAGMKVIVRLLDLPLFIDIPVPPGVSDTSIIKKINEVCFLLDKCEVKMKTVRMYPGKELSAEPLNYIRIYFNAMFRRKKFIEKAFERKLETANCDVKYELLLARISNMKSCGWNMIFNYKEMQNEIADRSKVRYQFEINWKYIISAEALSIGADVSYAAKFDHKEKIFEIPHFDKKNMEAELASPDCIYEKLMICAWDLETYTPAKLGGVPKPENPADKIKMCSMVLRWYWDTRNLCKIIISSCEVPKLPDVVTIITEDIPAAMADVIAAAQPDLITGFNDGSYDWPFIKERITDTRSFRRKICPINFDPDDSYSGNICGPLHKGKNIYPQIQRIKIDAETTAEYDGYLSFGSIIFDTQIVMRRRDTTETKFKSLNSFLEKYGIAPKEDMPYDKMARIFHIEELLKEKFKLRTYAEMIQFLEEKINMGNSTKENKGFFAKFANEDKTGNLRICHMTAEQILEHMLCMDKVVTYCIRDSEACIDLLKKINAIPDICDLGTSSYTFIKHGFFNANGMKVQNKILHHAMKPLWGIGAEKCPLAFRLYSGPYKGDEKKQKKEDKKKFPGGYVPEPVMGFYARTLFERRKARRNATGSAEPCRPEFNPTLLFNDKELAEVYGIKTRREIHYGRNARNAENNIKNTRNAESSKNAENNIKNSEYEKNSINTGNAENGENCKIEENAKNGENCDENFRFYFRLFKEKFGDHFEKFRNEVEQYFTELDELSSDLYEQFCENKDYCDIHSRPCSGIDFASLYPSLIMTYNFSPEMYCKRYNVKRFSGYRFLDISTVYKEDKATYVPELHLFEGSFLQHNVSEKGELINHGIFPTILRTLFADRKCVKKIMSEYSCMLEKMNKEFPADLMRDLRSGKKDIKDILEFLDGKLKTFEGRELKKLEKARFGYYGFVKSMFIKHLQPLYENLENQRLGPILNDQNRMAAEKMRIFCEFVKDIEFKEKMLNTKQNSMKVFMNTFYGLMGNPFSPFFIVEMSGGVTAKGRDSLQAAQKFVTDVDYIVYYGDTDSIYGSAPECYFAEADYSYAAGEINKIAFFELMVEITMDRMDYIVDEIASYFKRTTGNSFLSMSYEEVMFPYMFLGKKHYIGVKHETSIDFSVCSETNPDKFMKGMLARGIATRKRDNSGFSKNNYIRILMMIFNLEEYRSIEQIIMTEIKNLISNRTGNLEQFKKNYNFASPRENTKTAQLRFRTRMLRIQIIEKANKCAYYISEYLRGNLGLKEFRDLLNYLYFYLKDGEFPFENNIPFIEQYWIDFESKFNLVSIDIKSEKSENSYNSIKSEKSENSYNSIKSENSYNSIKSEKSENQFISGNSIKSEKSENSHNSIKSENNISIKSNNTSHSVEIRVGDIIVKHNLSLIEGGIKIGPLDIKINMEWLNLEVPVPQFGTRENIIYALKAQKLNMRGNPVKIAKGDLFEFPEFCGNKTYASLLQYAEGHSGDVKINIQAYFEELFGKLSQFLIYYPKFLKMDKKKTKDFVEKKLRESFIESFEILPVDTSFQKEKYSIVRKSIVSEYNNAMVREFLKRVTEEKLQINTAIAAIGRLLMETASENLELNRSRFISGRGELVAVIRGHLLKEYTARAKIAEKKFYALYYEMLTHFRNKIMTLEDEDFAKMGKLCDAWEDAIWLGRYTYILKVIADKKAMSQKQLLRSFDDEDL